MSQELGLGIEVAGTGSRPAVYHNTNDIYLIDSGYVKRYSRNGVLLATSALSGLDNYSRMIINQYNGDLWVSKDNNLYQLDITALTTSVTVTSTGSKISDFAIDESYRDATYLDGRAIVLSNDGATLHTYTESFDRTGGAALFTNTQTAAGNWTYFARYISLQPSDGRIIYHRWDWDAVFSTTAQELRSCDYDGSNDASETTADVSNFMAVVNNNTSTFYGLDQTLNILYKSINHGATWTSWKTGLGIGEGSIYFDTINSRIVCLGPSATKVYDEAGTLLYESVGGPDISAYIDTDSQPPINQKCIHMRNDEEAYYVAFDGADKMETWLLPKNIHVTSVGRAVRPYSNWGDACNDLQTAATSVTSHLDKIHLDAEAITVIPVQIFCDTDGDAGGTGYAHSWIGGYNYTGAETDYSDTTRNGKTIINGASITGAGSKDDGLFATKTKSNVRSVTFDGLHVINSGSSSFSMNSNTTGGVGRYDFLNCVLVTAGYPIYSFNASSIVHMTNCTVDTGSRVWYNFSGATEIFIANSCIFTNINIAFTYKAVTTQTVTYSTFYGNGFAMPSGTGNDAVDPDYVNSGASDFNLIPYTSPCIATGDPALDYSLEPQPNGGVVNRGAFGGTLLASFANDLTDWYVSSAGSNTAPYDTWPKAADTIQTALDHFKLASTQEGNINLDAESFAPASVTGLLYGINIVPKDTVFKSTLQGLTAAFDNGSLKIADILLDGTINITTPDGITIQRCDAMNSEEASITLTNSRNVVIDHITCYMNASNLITIDTCLFSIKNIVTNIRGGYIGVRVKGGSLGGILNSIFYGGGDIGNVCISSEESSYITSSYNCFYNDGATIIKYQELTGGLITNKTGDFEDNPDFAGVIADVITDAHLLSISPCINTGDPLSSFLNEPQPNGNRINLGRWGDTTEAKSDYSSVNVTVMQEHLGQLIWAIDGNGIVETLDESGWTAGEISTGSPCQAVKCTLNKTLGYFQFEKQSVGGGWSILGYIALKK